MSWRMMGNLALLTLCLGGSAVAATPSPVADAAEKRDPAAVRALLGSATQLGNATGVNAPQPDGTTALHWAAYHDDAETAAVLVRAGANVNAVNRYGVAPLSVACSNGSG